MKVKIITRHAIANYGSLLQSYATQKTFEKLGFESEIIDYIRIEEKPKNLVNTYTQNSKFWNKNFFTRLMYKLIQIPNLNKMNNKFEKYRKKYLNLTEKEYTTEEELKKNLPEADIYCTGSDQVWGQIANDDYDKNYFLSFVPENKKCISYAASFGKTDISLELKKKLPDLLKKYKKILVREESAKKIIESVGIDKVEMVLDPTLLLSKLEWEKLYNEKYKKNEDYILVYQLHHNKNFDRYLKKIKKTTKLKIYRINPSFYFKFKPGKLVYLPSLEEFITLFHNAKYVITDSFHGTVFSIIFNIPMIDILPQKTGTRIQSILKLFGIEERLLKYFEDFSIFDKKFDFNKLNEIVKKEQIKSLNLLKESLN